MGKNNWMKKLILLALFSAAYLAEAVAQDIIYDKADSIKIVRILKNANKRPASKNRCVYFGEQFLGVPYVASTLEVGDKERLVVNTQGLDCTTFVETVVALTMCDKQNKRTFKDYCNNLKKIRYWNGEKKGYASRLHYFAFWIKDNEDKGIVSEVLTPSTPYTRQQTLCVNYMTQNPDKYKHLKNNPKNISAVKYYEDQFEGMKVRYIPKEYFNLPRKKLSFVKDGDIIGLVTKKKGLDTTHLGIAVWKNGKLHLLNASYLRKKVVLEKQTLYRYSQGQKSQIGMRLARVK